MPSLLTIESDSSENWWSRLEIKKIKNESKTYFNKIEILIYEYNSSLYDKHFANGCPSIKNILLYIITIFFFTSWLNWSRNLNDIL